MKKWSKKDEERIEKSFNSLVNEVIKYKKTLKNKKQLDKTPKH